jgi:tripeptidyl-peptidase-1
VFYLPAVSLLNSNRLAVGLPSVGFLNPTLYSSGFSYYNDITSGENNCCSYPDQTTCCDAGFTATAGWDPVTVLPQSMLYITVHCC